MSGYRLSISILLFLFLRHSAQTPSPTSPTNKFPPCDSFSLSQQRFSCFRSRKIHEFRQFLPSLAPPGSNEIDPRYGVEKRLVPSGPNPLHN
ncbi:hypothetical protein HRI_004133100 [Hibiscus trionum]|uniref:Uncharacterized protein n=1 Tax=Hibiscus trionum TaxID=183268 RepID=A0A9W7J0H8_HIBTR|nr:hypothetical protein HRI_004133100 [Hibiscus trionum]